MLSKPAAEEADVHYAITELDFTKQTNISYKLTWKVDISDFTLTLTFALH